MIRILAIILAAVVFVWGAPAFAYIDPGTGQAIYSVLAPFIAILIGFLGLILRYFKRITAFVKGRFR